MICCSACIDAGYKLLLDAQEEKSALVCIFWQVATTSTPSWIAVLCNFVNFVCFLYFAFFLLYSLVFCLISNTLINHWLSQKYLPHPVMRIKWTYAIMPQVIIWNCGKSCQFQKFHITQNIVHKRKQVYYFIWWNGVCPKSIVGYVVV